MRDKQVADFLHGWSGFRRGVISSDKPAECVNLSEVLETGTMPTRYFLSPRACAGILRRAEKRGRELPRVLSRALQSAASPPPAPNMEK
jgi:hypothetical protein